METLFLPHLNTQTNSNLSFSFLTISQLIDWAVNNKLNYLSIADYYPYEIIEFFNSCKAKKIKPVWGVKIFLQENPQGKKYSATIYPQNNKGYKEILQKLFSWDSPKDRIFSFDYVLSSLSKNCLVVFEAQKLEEIKYFATQWILNQSPQKEVNYNNLFVGFNFFLLSPAQTIPQNIIPLLLPFFAVKCLTSEETKLLGLWKKTSFNRYFFSVDTQGDFFSYLNTNDYFPHCTDDKTFYQLLLIQWQAFLAKISLNPSFNSEKKSRTKKESPLLLLKSKCLQKLISLKKEPAESYQKTLERELAVIEKLNYADYFLVFSEVNEHLKKENIMVGPGRGSAVSSLVAYLLGITSIDPLEHKLLFERFLNEKRKNLPDIDLDVENQEEVFNYLQKKYPKRQVARIITKKKTSWKVALREASKLYKVGEIKLKEITSLTGENPNFNDLKLQYWQTSYPNLFQLASKIQNLYYDTGIHPSGVIISEISLIGTVPLRSEKDYLLTLFEEDRIAELRLKKYDFLSLRETLGFIHKAREILKVNLPDYQEVDLTDQKTWELFKNFLLTGIFQLDTSSARGLLFAFCPKSFLELNIFLALNRPGIPLSIKKEIIKRKTNEKTSLLVTPKIREILTETYGFIIFEEQISQVIALIYDCSFAEAEVKRRNLPGKPLEKDFLTRAKTKVTPLEAQLIYTQITSIAGYTFNKAHAVAYSYLTYYIAYLKANFFPELITYFLNKKKEKELSYLQEAFFYGFQIKGPDVNYSEIEWIKKGQELLMGFSNLKEYKVEFFQNLIEERKKGGVYKNWEDLINRTIIYWEKVNKSSFEMWIKGGIFRSLGLEDDNLLSHQEAIFRYLSIRKNLPTLNNNLPFLDLATKIPKENKAVINQREFESLGLYISYFSRWKELVQEKYETSLENKICSFSEIFQKIEKHDDQKISINVYAVIYQIEKKDKDNYYTLFLQDVRNSFKLDVNSAFYLANQENLATHSELLFTLKAGVRQGKINTLVCERISGV